MKHFLRPYRSVGIVALVGMGAGMGISPWTAVGQSTNMVEVLPGVRMVVHGSQPGYLGVWVEDIDNEKAQALKLKEVRGAVITLVDHDAPVCQKGMLRVNDVVLQLNGQNVENAEQWRRMLKQIPPGHAVSMEISRDGDVQTLSVQLVDHRAMEHDVWNKLNKHEDSLGQQTPTMGVLPGASDAPLPGMFNMPIWGANLNVGALVEPIGAQMQDWLGVPSGLYVKQVARRTEAAAAGLRAKDVILKVGTDTVTTVSDWERALRSNQGKPVQVTVLREGKQVTLTLQVDSKRKTGALKEPEPEPAGVDATV